MFFNLRFENLSSSIDTLSAEDARLTAQIQVGLHDIRSLVEQLATSGDLVAREVARSVQEVNAISGSVEIVAEMARAVELAERRLEATSISILTAVERIEAPSDPEMAITELFDIELAELGPSAALFLSQGALLDGIGEPSGLLINDGIALTYEEGGHRLVGLNERLVENPFVFAATWRLSPGSSIIDIGSRESALPISLAMNGYRVVTLDPRGYAYRHPGITSISATVSDWIGPEDAVDAVTCVSAIEHFGIGAYKQTEEVGRLDLEAMKRFRSWLSASGILVLTVPFGTSALNSLQRVYDFDGIEELTDGFTVTKSEVYQRIDDMAWRRLSKDSRRKRWEAETPGVICLIATPN